jgi:hypothetical protein
MEPGVGQAVADPVLFEFQTEVVNETANPNLFGEGGSGSNNRRPRRFDFDLRGDDEDEERPVGPGLQGVQAVEVEFRDLEL